MNTDTPQNKFNSLSWDEQSALYSLKSDKDIVKKVPIRVSRLLSGIGVIILKWLRNNLEIKIFMWRYVMILDLCVISNRRKVIEKIRKRGDLNADTIKYFMVKDPKFTRFYLLPKIHKLLHDVPDPPVISTCG